jgi:hypothetical protein
MTMSETKQPTNWLPWIIVAGLLGLLIWDRGRKDPGPQPEPVPSVSVEKDAKAILAKLKVEFSRVFSEAADKVESKAIKTDKELFDFVKPATEAARKEANKPFDVSFDLSLPRNDDGSFSGKEKEASALLRRVAKSW